VVINKVTRSADNEKIANILVEDNFRGSAGVGTTQDDGKGMLSLCSFGAFGGSGLAGGDLAFGKAGIAFFEFCEGGIRVEGRGGMVGGKDKPSEAE